MNDIGGKEFVFARCSSVLYTLDTCCSSVLHTLDTRCSSVLHISNASYSFVLHLLNAHCPDVISERSRAANAENAREIAACAKVDGR